MNHRARSAAHLTSLALLAGFSASASAATEIHLWHAMTGALGEKLVAIANQFNASQTEYKVTPVFKGNYDETMNAGIAAYRAGSAPHILQVFEVGTATMMSAKGAVKPVFQLMDEAGEKFDPKNYISAVAGYYTNSQGKMLSFPFNSSTTVFYYNKDAFQKAGLDPNRPPKTWPEVGAAAAKLKIAGYACPYTTSWQSWVHLENFSAWHNTQFATKNNGFDGLDTRLAFNSPLHVKHITNLQDWAKKGYFVYGGRKNEPDAKFFSGECAMHTGSSATYGNIVKNAKFQFGVSALPYYADVEAAPQNTIIGGASLWVLAGKKKEEYKGIAKFFSFLAKPETQAEWHQGTGYLPITQAAYDLTKKQGHYDKNPGTDVSVKQMIDKAATAKSRGIRLGSFVQIRTIIDEELEAVWAGKKQPKEALDTAVERGNELLTKFEKTNK